MKLNIECFLLCGGSSKRFKGDKRFALFEGIPLYLYQYKKVKKIFNKINVIIKKGDNIENILPREKIIEKEKDRAMIIGIYNGLKNLKGEKGFFLAVDMPFVPYEFIIKILKFNSYYGIAPIFKGKPHFGVSVFHKKSLKLIKEKILKKNYALKDLFQKDGFFLWNLDFEDWIKKYKEPFFNINFKNDLKEINYEGFTNNWG